MTAVDKSCGRVEASDGTSFSGRQDSQARRIIRWILFAARSSRRRRLGQPPPLPLHPQDTQDGPYAAWTGCGARIWASGTGSGGLEGWIGMRKFGWDALACAPRSVRRTLHPRTDVLYRAADRKSTSSALLRPRRGCSTSSAAPTCALFCIFASSCKLNALHITGAPPLAWPSQAPRVPAPQHLLAQPPEVCAHRP